MTEDQIIAALSVLTWSQRASQTFTDSMLRESALERRAHVLETGMLYRAMLADASDLPTGFVNERPSRRAG